MSIRHLRLVREQRGQGMVEFALILPVLLLILVGIIEFGSIYSHVISMRQGVREAGRQGSVANFGPTCTLPDSTGASQNMVNLMCYAKDQAGVGDAAKYRIKFANISATPPTVSEAGADYCSPDAGGTCKGGNAILVCAVYPLQSLTGLFQPFLDGHYARTKAAFRIEKVSSVGVAESGGGEPDPSGDNWNWCKAT
jgi:hypothetical protein